MEESPYVWVMSGKLVLGVIRLQNVFLFFEHLVTCRIIGVCSVGAPRRTHVWVLATPIHLGLSALFTVPLFISST